MGEQNGCGCFQHAACDRRAARGLGRWCSEAMRTAVPAPMPPHPRRNLWGEIIPARGRDVVAARRAASESAQ